MMVQGVVMVVIAVGIGGANGSSSPCCRDFWVEIHPFFHDLCAGTYDVSGLGRQGKTGSSLQVRALNHQVAKKYR